MQLYIIQVFYADYQCIVLSEMALKKVFFLLILSVGLPVSVGLRSL